MGLAKAGRIMAGMSLREEVRDTDSVPVRAISGNHRFQLTRWIQIQLSQTEFEAACDGGVRTSEGISSLFSLARDGITGLIAETKYLTKAAKGGKVCFGHRYSPSQYRAGAGGRWSHSQEAKRHGCWCSAPFLLLFSP